MSRRTFRKSSNSVRVEVTLSLSLDQLHPTAKRIIFHLRLHFNNSNTKHSTIFQKNKIYIIFETGRKLLAHIFFSRLRISHFTEKSSWGRESRDHTLAWCVRQKSEMLVMCWYIKIHFVSWHWVCGNFLCPMLNISFLSQSLDNIKSNFPLGRAENICDKDGGNSERDIFQNLWKKNKKTF